MCGRPTKYAVEISLVQQEMYANILFLNENCIRRTYVLVQPHASAHSHA